MIKLLIVGVFLLCVFNSCQEEYLSSEQESVSSAGMRSIKSACGTTELGWLQEIIEKAEEDKRSMAHQGNFLGAIYQESYKDEVVIFVRMMMGSGGVYGYVYRCDGSRVDFNNDPQEVESFFQNLKEDQIIYKNVP